ncbi:DUF3127 domain-containing protein [Planktomarina temperata]|nr:DUF3127 domain-containing protein [Planktomarina temperata]
MEISGKIIGLLTQQTGKSANGEWRKQEYILETEAQYPKKICFMVWGDKIDQFGIKIGERLTVSIDLESREYNSRWYTDVKAWKVVREAYEATSSQSMSREDFMNQDNISNGSIDNKDIPF